MPSPQAAAAAFPLPSLGGLEFVLPVSLQSVVFEALAPAVITILGARDYRRVLSRLLAMTLHKAARRGVSCAERE